MNNNPNNINQMNQNNGTVNQNVNNINNAVQSGMQMGAVNQVHTQTGTQPMQGQNVMPNQNIGQMQNFKFTISKGSSNAKYESAKSTKYSSRSNY